MHRLFIERNPANFTQFVWVTSHVGIHGNEIANEVAKNATNGTTRPCSPVSFTDFYQRFHCEAREGSEAVNMREGSTKGANYFECLRYVRRWPWFRNKEIPRSVIVSVNRMRSNHHSLEASLHRKGIIDSPGCACGREIDNLEHVAWDCVLYSAQHVMLLRQLSRIGLRPP
ncbi:hypothetical protein TKK_0014541 [Trichogramma kaykai]